MGDIDKSNIEERLTEFETAIAAFRDAWENDGGTEDDWEKEVLSTRTQLFELVMERHKETSNDYL